LRFIYNKYAYTLCFSLTCVIQEFNESKEIDKKRLKFNLQFSLEAHAYCKNNTSDEEGNQDPFMPDDNFMYSNVIGPKILSI
jgi:hypothetical protein